MKLKLINFTPLNGFLLKSHLSPKSMIEQKLKTSSKKHSVESIHNWLELGTEAIGNAVTPVIDHPLVKYINKVPGISCLPAALGQVDINKAKEEVDQLKQEYTLDTHAQLAHRIIVETALIAGGIGLFTNLLPPIALLLFEIDLVAIAALQAEMVYRIAEIYGFPLEDTTRRGEVLAIFGLSIGGFAALKFGLSIVEMVPLVSSVVGAASDAALIYTLGFFACQYFESKRKSTPTTIFLDF
jgi:uncharacterized protein (DUF697 family)